MKLFNKPDKYFWIANAFIILSLVIFFSRSLFTDRILTSGDFEIYPFFESHHTMRIDKELPLLDPIDFIVPMLHFNKQMLKTDKLPLWNPYQGCGVPHIGNMQSSFFSPLNIFVYLFSWKWGLLLLYFFKLYVIGLLLYLYLKEIDTSPPVAIVFSIAGIYMSFIVLGLYFPFTNIVFFFPLALWATESIIKNPIHFSGYLIYCLGFVFAVFGGHPEMLFYTMFILILYWIIRLYQTHKLNISVNLSISGKLIAIFIIALLISSVQLVPFLEYFHLSSAYLSRSTLELPINNIPGYFLLFNILPTITRNYLGILIGYVFNQYQTVPIFTYTGISILSLAIAGIMVLNKDNIVKTFIIISIIVLCVGFKIPIIHSIVMHLPGFSIGRNYYILTFTAWALLIISSKTLDNLIQGRLNIKYIKFAVLIILGLIIIFASFFITAVYPSLPSPIKSILSYYLALSMVAAIMLMLLTLWVLKIKNKTWLLFALGVLMYAQTALPVIFIEPAIKPEYFYPNNKIFSLLQQDHSTPFRVTALISNTLPIAYPTNINTFYKIEDIRNYDSMGVNWYNSFFSYVPESDALNLTNVKYIIVKSGYDLSNLTNIFHRVTEYNGFILYKNLSAYNRAFMVYNYAVAESQQQAVDLLHAYSGQLNHVAIVFHKDIQGMPLTTNTQGTYKINFITYTPGYIKLSCTTSQPGLFFISDTYFPGWHARVDGKETKIIRTDYAFQGLWLTQGTHTIELNYDPASFKYGVLLSIIGIISLVGFYLILFRKREQ